MRVVSDLKKIECWIYLKEISTMDMNLKDSIYPPHVAFCGCYDSQVGWVTLYSWCWKQSFAKSQLCN